MPAGQGRGGGMGKGRQGMGPPKECKCPSCGHTIPHQPGQPCSNQSCPKCGTNMVGM